MKNAYQSKTHRNDSLPISNGFDAIIVGKELSIIQGPNQLRFDEFGQTYQFSEINSQTHQLLGTLLKTTIFSH